MKTEKQIERDKQNGVLNLEHSYEKKTGKIISKGLIRKELDPEKVLESTKEVKAKAKEFEENLKLMKAKLSSAPVNCNADVLEFLEVQKRAGEWLQAESLRTQVAQRQADYDTLLDDIIEQEVLLKEYADWKK